ncbi:MAG: sugar phosphate isomerase/epimerase, partial [Clostridia bacterium]|nr:sugar phosphate isomerase/epimerase [Clostridia bacterium]
APFPSYRVGDEEYNKKIFPMLTRSIEAAGIVGAKNIVVHPVFFPENKKERNLELYNSLLPYAKQAGVRIAVENMWGRDHRSDVIVPNVCSVASELADYVDSLDPDWFTVCLDIGHIGLVHEQEAPFIRELGGKRLTCVHVHDNDYVHDLHITPFWGKLPWGEIAKAFADIDYRGDITLEADDALLRNMPLELYPACLKFMEQAGRHLIRMIEEAK